ncbi:MAG: hypothetical protein QOH99_1520 [Frankiaceae bacterium]|nr:hypothetical protein [Frankiaceae bacterium]
MGAVTDHTPPRRAWPRRRRGSLRVIPAERWQRAAGWLIDVFPFVLVGGSLVLWVEGPGFVLGGLRTLLGFSGASLPTSPGSATGTAARHSSFADLVLLVVALVLLAVAWVAYRVIATARYGQTFGKWLVGSRVVRIDDPTRPPSMKQSWRRFLVPQTAGWLPMPGTGLLPYLSLCLHPRRRGLHDKVAGTIVVKTERPHLPHPLQQGAIGERQSVGENS